MAAEAELTPTSSSAADPSGPDVGSSAVPRTDGDAVSMSAVVNGLRVLAERLEKVEDGQSTAAATLGKVQVDLGALQAVVASLIKKDRTPIPPLAWADRAGADDWVQLADWIDWLISRYEFVSARIPACWPSHPGVVEELAGLWRAWAEATIADTRAKWAGSSDLTAWHDRWLWPTLDRIQHDRYLIKNCHTTHEQPYAPPPRTDRTCLPV